MPRTSSHACLTGVGSVPGAGRLQFRNGSASLLRVLTSDIAESGWARALSHGCHFPNGQTRSVGLRSFWRDVQIRADSVHLTRNSPFPGVQLAKSSGFRDGSDQAETGMASALVQRKCECAGWVSKRCAPQ